MVGGFSYEQSKFNRATQSLVQVGSSIKPFIYAAALEKGLTLSSVLQDSPISIQKPGQPLWQPKNSPDRYDGPMRLRVGLGQSKNMIAIRAYKPQVLALRLTSYNVLDSNVTNILPVKRLH